MRENVLRWLKIMGLVLKELMALTGELWGNLKLLILLYTQTRKKIRGQCKVRNKLPKYIKIPEGCDIVLLKEDRGDLYVLQKYDDWLSEVGNGLL